MKSIINFFDILDVIITKFLKIVCITFFILLSLIISAGVFVRFVPIASLHWFDEIVELLYAYLVFLGAAALFAGKSLIKIDWLKEKLNKKPKLSFFYNLLLNLIILTFLIIFFYQSLRLTILAKDVTNVFQYPKKITYACMPLGGLIMIIYSVKRIINEIIDFVKPINEEEKELF